MTLKVGDEQAEPLTRNGRQALADDLLDELTAWSPRDREGMFKTWHRGALSLIHLNVLTVLELQGPLTMSMLAQTLDVSDASATGIVDRMERRGLVERRRAAGDRRLVLVHPTSAGSSVFSDLRERRREHLSRLLQELTDDELAGFLTGLRAMRAARARLRAAEAVADDGASTSAGTVTAVPCPAGAGPDPATNTNGGSDRP